MLSEQRPVVRIAAAAAVAGTLAVAVFVGVSLVRGGEDDPPPFAYGTIPPTPPPDLTPPPPGSPYPTQDPSLPTQPDDDRYRTPDPNWTPAPLRIGDVDVPVPVGATIRGGIADPGGYSFWSFHLGDSFIRFDEFGLTGAEIEPAHEDSFDASLDALWSVARQNAQPSPPSLEVNGVSVALPSGSFYSTLTNPLSPANPIYIVRLRHSVLSFDSTGIESSSIRAADQSAFNSTLINLEAPALDE